MSDDRANHRCSIEGVSFGPMTWEESEKLHEDHRRLSTGDDIGWKVAAQLLKEFGSIEEIRDASEAELKQVDGIGRIRASSIRDAVEE